MKRLERYVVTGLAVVGPVFLSLYLIFIAFKFIDSILGKFVNALFQHYLGLTIPGLGFLLFFLIVIFFGFLATRFVGHKLGLQLERWFSGLPLVNILYPAIKQIVLFVSAQKELGFKSVVMAEYPSKGIWSLGFITNERFNSLNLAASKDLVAVFFPTTPSPISGYVVFIAKQDLKFPDISVSDAIKILISGGVFKP